jgi:hypothetical protein
LGDESAHARLARCVEEVVGAFGAQPVSLREGSVEVPAEADVCERGRLMDDRVGLGAHDRFMDGLGVERIEHGRLRAEFAQLWRLFGRVACADDLVAALEQMRNEPTADRATRSYDEHLHRLLLL